MSPLALLRRLVHALLTIKFGVVLMVFLMLVMMFATQFEASTSTRAMQYYIYGSPWFDASVFLFVVNITVNTWRRRPYRFRHLGFLTVHAGVLTIVAGGLLSRWFAVDGTMPIAEGESGRAILLPENDIVVEAAGRTTRHSATYELRPWEENPRDLWDVPGTPYRLSVDRYFSTAAVVDTVLDDAPEPNPMIRVALGTEESRWLAARDPERNELRTDTARVRFVEADAWPALRARWAAGGDREASPPAGELRLFWTDGGSEVLTVPAGRPDRLPTSRPGVTLEIVRIFRSFAVTARGYRDAEGEPDNPALHFRVHGPEGVESHFSFAAHPEFRADPPAGREWVVSRATWRPEPPGTADPRDLGEIAIVQERPGRLVTWARGGDPRDGQPLGIGETRTFEESGAAVRILEWLPRGRVAREVRRVSGDVTRPVLRVRLVESPPRPRLASVFDAVRGRRPSKPADCDPDRAWIFHGTHFDFETPHGTVRVGYEGRTIPLDFGIRLEDFREEKYPGVSLAASYESHVRVEPAEGEEFPVKICMNHPLKHAGYTFYQANFQRTSRGREVTVLSVARDPGMRVSFAGYCVLVAGLLLIFFVKPYLARLDDRRARGRSAIPEGAGT